MTCRRQIGNPWSILSVAHWTCPKRSGGPTRERHLLPHCTHTTPPIVAKTAAAELDGNINFDPQFHLKLAQVILESEEGVKLARTILLERKGQEEAASIIKNAMDAHAIYLQGEEQLAEMEKQASTQEFQQALMIKQAFDAMSPADKKLTVKIAAAHKSASARFTHPLLKYAYAQGADDAGSAAASMGGDPSQGGDPAAMQGEPQIPGDGGQGGEQGPASIEELANVLMMLVQSGEIDQATAEKVMQDLQAGQGGGGEGGAPGGAPGGGGEEGAPAEAAPGASPEEAEGADAAKKAHAILKTAGAIGTPAAENK